MKNKKGKLPSRTPGGPKGMAASVRKAHIAKIKQAHHPRTQNAGSQSPRPGQHPK